MREEIIGDARLILGDCLEILPTLPKVDAVVTDPPYSAAGGNTNGRTSGAEHQYWEYWFESVWAKVADVATEDAFAFVFCDWRMIGTLSTAIRGKSSRLRGKAWEVTQALVWDRECFGLGAPYRNAFEMIAFARAEDWKQKAFFPRNLPTVIRHRWPYGRHEHHGAEKPVALLKELMELHAPSCVLDPFMGSGSTGVACMQMKRRFIGIELEERYFDIACRRIEAAYAQGRLFDEPAPQPKQEALL